MVFIAIHGIGDYNIFIKINCHPERRRGVTIRDNHASTTLGMTKGEAILGVIIIKRTN
jgi:hypothetical protein